MLEDKGINTESRRGVEACAMGWVSGGKGVCRP